MWQYGGCSNWFQRSEVLSMIWCVVVDMVGEST